MQNTIIDNADALYVKIAEMRRAQSVFTEFTQEQVDKIFLRTMKTKEN